MTFVRNNASTIANKRLSVINSWMSRPNVQMSTAAATAGGGSGSEAAAAAEVLTVKKGSVREVVLNRPKKLNALNLNMIELMLPEIKAWEKSDLAKIILLKSCGGKGFCAGGDVKTVVDLAAEGKHVDALKFFEVEYQLDHLIGTLKTPYVAVMDGITMGGGVGLSVHAPFRIATENTLFAMPETGIGFLPEVGGSFFLSRLDGQLGIYLGLTGKRLKGTDAFYAGIATHYIPSSRLSALESRLAEIDEPTYDKINTAIEEFAAEMDQEAPFSLAGPTREAIDRCFKFDTVEEIIDALQKEDSEWAKETLKLMGNVSPTSLKVTLQQLRTGANLTLGECFKMEYRLVQKFLEEHDFTEGVNATLDKPRRKAEWKPTQVADVKLADIKKEYFDASDKKPLELISEDDYDRYPHSKYMLPSEQDIQSVVTGEAPGVGNYALSSDEVVDYFINDRKGKQGVKNKVLDVLARKTQAIKNDESNSLKWIY
ncbi:ClpP/crotonase [Lichtheimia hyalospora FSU 10163]|nr:ClpP/crotonase [Lichtheimia hyalospora FSU 10163]